MCSQDGFFEIEVLSESERNASNGALMYDIIYKLVRWPRTFCARRLLRSGARSHIIYGCASCMASVLAYIAFLEVQLAVESVLPPRL